jgi:hypothetical protein
MKISDFKAQLASMQSLSFRLPNGETIPAHFHITEVGKVTKNYIDCGGTVREESKVNFQLWIANDTDHRLDPSKLLGIIELANPLIGSQDLDIEFEYQGDTICKYGIQSILGQFVLTATQTDCLAKDHCGIPQYKMPVKLADLTPNGGSSCTPGGGCC